jgi:V-type H+-transporting ATPase subunit d
MLYSALCAIFLLLTTSFSYIEGIVRGYRNGLLTGNNYTNMTQCETIDGSRPPISVSLSDPT